DERGGSRRPAGPAPRMGRAERRRPVDARGSGDGHPHRHTGAGARTGRSVRRARRAGTDHLAGAAAVRQPGPRDGGAHGRRGRPPRAIDLVMDAAEAVRVVLAEEQAPLHWTVIQDRALRHGYLDPFTQPDVRGEVLRALAAGVADGSLRRGEAKGVYEL